MPPRPSRERRVIERLLAARGIRRFALFLLQQEGLALPDGLEAVSGFVLDADGAVHGFWLDWDAERGSHALAPFYPVEDPERAFAADEEYRAARRSVGLDAPDPPKRPTV